MSTHFPEDIQPPADEIMDEVWNARALLVEMHGGLHGLVEYLRQQDDAELPGKVRLAPEIACNAEEPVE